MEINKKCGSSHLAGKTVQAAPILIWYIKKKDNLQYNKKGNCQSEQY